MAEDVTISAITTALDEAVQRLVDAQPARSLPTETLLKGIAIFIARVLCEVSEPGERQAAIDDFTLTLTRAVQAVVNVKDRQPD